MPVAKGTAIVDGVSYPILDISTTGFRIGAYNGRLRDGLGFQVRIIMPYGSQIVGINAEAIVERLTTKTGILAASFSSLSSSAEEKLAIYVASRAT